MYEKRIKRLIDIIFSLLGLIKAAVSRLAEVKNG